MKRIIVLILSIICVLLSLTSCMTKKLVDVYEEAESLQELVKPLETEFLDNRVVLLEDDKDPNDYIELKCYGELHNKEIIPGELYENYPVLTIKEGCDNCYVRVIVTLRLENQINENILNKLDYIFYKINNNWQIHSKEYAYDSVTYQFRYRQRVSGMNYDYELEPVYEGIYFDPCYWGNELKDLDNMQIDVEGHAIQAENFSGADEAWEAFNE